MPIMRRSIVAIVVLCASLLASAPAVAHQSPAGCTTSGANVRLSGIGLHRNGDVVSVVPNVQNTSTKACDVTDATVTIQFPAADGSPGPKQVVATGLDLPAGTPKTNLTEPPPNSD